MPSFLSKVFGRKKDGKGSPPSRGRASDGSLLDGKFEAISPVNTPSAAEFPENALRGNGKEKDAAFGLFKVKSRPSRSSSPEPSKKENVPQLSLVLPVPKDDTQGRALGVVFEADPDAQILTDDAIGSKTLSPLEALILVRTCSQAIIARGLETLGLMHPHWYSASPDVQRRLISLFIHSLNPNNAITTLSPNFSSSSSMFESEINHTRSPHDVAAVLRWGLRHLELGEGKFGKDESWYKTFSEAERSSGYLPKSYSGKLTPSIPPAHLELLNTTLDLFSSLAAHAERNSTSASKLTRAFGLWLLAAQRVGENDDWLKFYTRWQDNGRILEHLFLARIRDESLRLRMPTRLAELVAQYPYVRGATPANDVFLPPRVSTRHFDALLVRVETEFSSPREKVHRHPLQFLKDALAADVVVGERELSTLWEKIRDTGNDEKGVSPGGYPGLSQAFADETIRYLTLISGDHPLKRVTSSAFNIAEVSQETASPRRYASSPGSPEAGSSDQVLNDTATTISHLKPASDPSPLPSAPNSSLPTDWVQFSSAGFSDVSAPLPLASTLFGQDVEKTNPPLRRASRYSKVPSSSRSTSVTRRKPVDITVPRRMSSSSGSEPPIKLPSKSFPVSVVEIDEAFIEFWVDALLDPISSSWPRFVICKLRSSLSEFTINDKRVQYLVVEHVFVPKPAPPAPPVEVAQSQPIEIARATSRDKSNVAPSPGRSSTKSEKNRFFGFFSSSGRHSLYGSSTTPSTKGKRKASPAHNVSELGEVLEDSGGGKRKSSSSTVRLKIPSPKSRKSADIPKSVEVPKLVADKDKAATEKEEKEKENSSSDVAAVPDAAVTVADAAAAALASAAAEEKDDAAATVSPPVAGTGAAEGSQFIEDLPKSAEESVKVTEEVKPEVARREGEPTTVAPVLVEAAQVQEQLVPISEGTVIQPAVSNGHTLPAIAEKAEDADATIPAPLSPVESAAETAVRDEPLTTTSAPELEASGVEHPTEEVSVIVESTVRSTPAPRSSPAPKPEASVPEHSAKAQEAVVDVPDTVEEPAVEEVARATEGLEAEITPVSVENMIAESIEEPAAETVVLAEEPAEEVKAVVEDVSTPAVETAIGNPAESTEAAVEEYSVSAPTNVEAPAAAEHPISAEETTGVVEQAVPAIATSTPAIEESAATYEETTKIAQDCPKVVDSVSAVPVSEVNVEEAPGPSSVELERINVEGTPSAAEVPVPSHYVEPVEDATAIQVPASENPVDTSEEIEQDPEVEATAVNGNGYPAAAPEKAGGDEAVPTELHVDAPVSDTVVPSEDAPEKLSEVIVEDD